MGVYILQSSMRCYPTGKAITSCTRVPLSLRVRAAAQKQKRENVETPNISTPPLPVGTNPLEATNVEEDPASSPEQDVTDMTTPESSASDENQLSPEEIGQQLKALRTSRGEVSTSPQDFWGGVWEETKLVEWPQFQKVLGTTGVVVGIIFGSSILLLTVNAILAELSDQVFNGSGEFAKSWTRGGF